MSRMIQPICLAAATSGSEAFDAASLILLMVGVSCILLVMPLFVVMAWAVSRLMVKLIGMSATLVDVCAKIPAPLVQNRERPPSPPAPQYSDVARVVRNVMRGGTGMPPIPPEEEAENDERLYEQHSIMD